jgi:hypothetical protein
MSICFTDKIWLITIKIKKVQQKCNKQNWWCNCDFLNQASWFITITRGYKDGLQLETLADGNWLVKQNQPVSKIETKSDTNLRSLYES